MQATFTANALRRSKEPVFEKRQSLSSPNIRQVCVILTTTSASGQSSVSTVSSRPSSVARVVCLARVTIALHGLSYNSDLTAASHVAQDAHALRRTRSVLSHHALTLQKMLLCFHLHDVAPTTSLIDDADNAVAVTTFRASPLRAYACNKMPVFSRPLFDISRWN